MPKSASGKALKQARKQLNITFKTVGTSETEDSTESDDSGDLSHVPLKSNIPLISNLSISEPTEMEQALTQMMEQLRLINENIAHITQRQENQEVAMQALAQPRNTDESPQQNNNDAPQENNNDAPQQNNNVAQSIRVEDFFRIPDPIKSLPSFDGNRKQLHAWLSTAEDTLKIFENRVNDQLYKMYVTAVTNKIEGKAKDILCLAGNPQQFDSIKSVLINALGDRQELSTYKCQLWQHKMTDGMSIHKYYQKSKELLQNIKTLAKQNQVYKDNWAAINLFIEEDGLAAFISGLKGTYFGHAQAARPKDIEDAYAFLCKFKSQEISAHAVTEKPQKLNKYPFKHETFTKNSNQNFTKPPIQTQVTEGNRKQFQQTPMEVDPSLRSRLTINKKIINNTEVQSANHDSSSEDEEEEEETEEILEGNVNFCVTTPHANPK